MNEIDVCDEWVGGAETVRVMNEWVELMGKGDE